MATALKNSVRNLMSRKKNLVNILMIAVDKAREPGFPTVRLGVDEVTYWNGKL
jgi:hypothetical protein